MKYSQSIGTNNDNALLKLKGGRGEKSNVVIFVRLEIRVKYSQAVHTANIANISVICMRQKGELLELCLTN